MIDDVWTYTEAELAAEAQANEQQIRRLLARQSALLAEVESRGPMATFGYGDTVALQVDLLHIGRPEAKRRAERARCLHPTGAGAAVLPALAPTTAAAAARGAIGPEHVDQILKTLVELPGTVSDEDRGHLETTLVELAGQATPQLVAKAGRHALALLNPDGDEPSGEESARPERELRMQWRRDNRLGFAGILDTETGVLLETLLSPLTKPRPAQDGERDKRPVEQRNGDALAELLEATQRSGELPIEGGERPTVVVSMNLEQVEAAAKAAIRWPFLNDTPISPEQARRICCDAKVIPAVLGSTGEALDLGRSQRVISPAQRRALNLRDKGCIKCGRPLKWCQGHHIIHWLNGGPTDLDNLCLLCTECHRLIHHSDWEIITGTDRLPRLIPPKWIDPDQTPRLSAARDPILV